MLNRDRRKGDNRCKTSYYVIPTDKVGNAYNGQLTRKDIRPQLKLGETKRWDCFTVASVKFDLCRSGHLWDWKHASRTNTLMNAYGLGDVIISSVFVQQNGTYTALTTTGLQIVAADNTLEDVITMFAIDADQLKMFFPMCNTNNMKAIVNRNIDLLKELYIY